jgi:hypothetical protein
VHGPTKLRPWTPDPIAPRIPPKPPQPVLRKGHDEYEVEEVLDSRYRGRGIQYLVKFKGYSKEHNEWLPSTNLTNAPRLTAKFHKENPEAPRRIAAVDFDRLPFRPYENLTEPAHIFRLYDWTSGRVLRDVAP